MFLEKLELLAERTLTVMCAPWNVFFWWRYLIGVFLWNDSRLILLKVPLNPNQSINQYLIGAHSPL